MEFDALSAASKLKTKVKVKIALEQAMKAKSGNTGIALLFL